MDSWRDIFWYLNDPILHFSPPPARTRARAHAPAAAVAKTEFCHDFLAILSGGRERTRKSQGKSGRLTIRHSSRAGGGQGNVFPRGGKFEWRPSSNNRDRRKRDYCSQLLPCANLPLFFRSLCPSSLSWPPVKSAREREEEALCIFGPGKLWS